MVSLSEVNCPSFYTIGAYRRCEPFLSTVAQPTEQTTIIKEAKIEALKSIAKTMFGIDLLEVKIAKEN